MGKYSTRQTPPPQRPYDVHPVWRGIGCILLLVAPPVAYAIAHLLVEANMTENWYPLPANLMNTVPVPQLGLTLTHVYANLLAATILLVLGSGLLMLIYTVIYSIVGPKRYSPMDSPEVRQPKRRSQR
ncbi:MAG: hypothetical protein ACKOC5_14100 [Chloroflexota bacterium]